MVLISTVPLVSNIYLPLNLGAATLYTNTKTKIVTVNFDDGRTVFETQKEVVGDILSGAGIFPGERDLVDPALDEVITSGVAEINIIKARKVMVLDGKDVLYGESPYSSSYEILADLSINIYAEDWVMAANPLEDLVTSPIIFIDRAPVVNLQVDGKSKEIHTRLSKVSDILVAEGISLGVKDRVSPSLDTKITDDISINVVRVSESENKEIIDLPFQTQYKDDPNMLKGETRVDQFGKIGKKEIIFKKIIENGREVSRVTLSEKILEQPVAQIVTRGIKTTVSGAYADWINDAASKYGVDASKMSRMMYCESGARPDAVGGGGRFHGLFQYLKSTWAGASSQAGWGGSSIYDPKAQIYTTAWKISIQGYRAWPVCGRL